MVLDSTDRGEVVYLVAGIGGLIAAVLLAVTVERIIKRSKRNKSADCQATEALSSGVAGMIDELRAGAHAAAAAEGAAEDTPTAGERGAEGRGRHVEVGR